MKMTIPDGIVGEEMEMKCEARGYPPPSLTWTIYTDKTVQNTTTIEKVLFGWRRKMGQSLMNRTKRFPRTLVSEVNLSYSI